MQDVVITPTHLRFKGRRLPRSIGRGGIRSDKCEGDGATPRAVLRVTGMLYRPDRMKRPAPWALPIRPGDLWSDDAGDAGYNSLVRTPYAGSHEALRRPDSLYDLVLLTDWNRPRVEPGRGSAIFLHEWRRARFPTEGCIALSRRDLRWFAARVEPGTRIFLKVPEGRLVQPPQPLA